MKSEGTKLKKWNNMEKANLHAVLSKRGIIPLNSQEVLERIPMVEHAKTAEDAKLLDDSILSLL